MNLNRELELVFTQEFSKKKNKFVYSLIFSCKYGEVIEPCVNKIEDDVK